MAPPFHPTPTTMFAEAKLDFQTHHDNVVLRRNLSHPNHTQQVTLGVIAAYVVAIAILWNVPYIKNILWPFKVRLALSRIPLASLPMY